jgi:hypothetical protein
VGEPAHQVLQGDRLKRRGYGFFERFSRPLSGLPDDVLYLRERFFYGVEVR